MSDGPYRSLPMSRGWKRLAEFSENANFDPADVCSAAVRALEETWRAEVPAPIMEGVRAVFLEEQPDLWANLRTQEAEALSSTACGSGFARLLADHTLGVLNEGVTGEAGLTEAANRALQARAARAARQIEEHYCREASAPVTKQVRERLEAAIANADFGALARRCAGLDSGTKTRRSLKHADIDDGVAL